jgi:anthranilate synthase/aminodeoxychorismate synthase-like glutamine amidotransferase
MRTVLVDPFDSFVHIIAHYLGSCGLDLEVVRSPDAPDHLVAHGLPDLLVLGPGPGTPEDSGHVQLVRHYAGTVPILGVCLGHQAIARAYGATVGRAPTPVHGKTSELRHTGTGMFTGYPSTARVARYHSLVVIPETLPPQLEVTAVSTDDEQIMAIRHRTLPIESVQFHPESIRTEHGMQLFKTFVAQHVTPHQTRPPIPMAS